MGQAIYFSPLNPLRLSVLSEAGVSLRETCFFRVTATTP